MAGGPLPPLAQNPNEAPPLLLKKNFVFVWTELHDATFHKLKLKLSHASVLALPDFSKQFVLETDACDKGIRPVLMQAAHPIVF